MSSRERYRPGPATGAEVRRDGERCTLVLVREPRHASSKVWQALTDPIRLREWAPFDADRSLAAVGPVTLRTVGIPQALVCETRVTRADAPRLLEYRWAENDLRWELQPISIGTRLTLWHNLDQRFLSMGAAGWHICLDVMDFFLAGEPLGRIVSGDAMKFDWPRLNGEYAQQFGIKPPAPPDMPVG